MISATKNRDLLLKLGLAESELSGIPAWTAYEKRLEALREKVVNRAMEEFDQRMRTAEFRRLLKTRIGVATAGDLASALAPSSLMAETAFAARRVAAEGLLLPRMKDIRIRAQPKVTRVEIEADRPIEIRSTPATLEVYQLPDKGFYVMAKPRGGKCVSGVIRSPVVTVKLYRRGKEISEKLDLRDKAPAQEIAGFWKE